MPVFWVVSVTAMPGMTIRRSTGISTRSIRDSSVSSDTKSLAEWICDTAAPALTKTMVAGKHAQTRHPRIGRNSNLRQTHQEIDDKKWEEIGVRRSNRR